MSPFQRSRIPAFVGILLASPLARADLPSPEAFPTLSAEARATLVRTTAPAELDRYLRSLSTETLLGLAQRTLAGLGGYRMRLVKEERMDGDLVGPQTMLMTVRESPFATYGEVLAGPAKGRRLFYNENIRRKELRVKEAGFAGIVGALWVNIESSLTRRDTLHPVLHLRYGALIGFIAGDVEKSKAWGGLARTDEGLKGNDFCMRFDAPEKATGLYGYRSRVCLDVLAGLPSTVEVSDRQGLFERFRFDLVEAGLPTSDAAFTPEAIGL